ncbi:hypothetical protein C8F04DRAFT_1349888 [Mycena alexandri]|uniref:Uncharacterized protein n=1 Tax=Mycena alexandri TaxID=1745969 RepID=A0AAD6RW20_9AGAR|nr:hypothetical protein C8F04DRAFT_1349888 [Mycena alexandri]
MITVLGGTPRDVEAWRTITDPAATLMQTKATQLRHTEQLHHRRYFRLLPTYFILNLNTIHFNPSQSLRRIEFYYAPSSSHAELRVGWISPRSSLTTGFVELNEFCLVQFDPAICIGVLGDRSYAHLISVSTHAQRSHHSTQLNVEFNCNSTPSFLRQPKIDSIPLPHAATTIHRIQMPAARPALRGSRQNPIELDPELTHRSAFRLPNMRRVRVRDSGEREAGWQGAARAWVPRPVRAGTSRPFPLPGYPRCVRHEGTRCRRRAQHQHVHRASPRTETGPASEPAAALARIPRVRRAGELGPRTAPQRASSCAKTERTRTHGDGIRDELRVSAHSTLVGGRGGYGGDEEQGWLRGREARAGWGTRGSARAGLATHCPARMRHSMQPANGAHRMRRCTRGGQSVGRR